MDTTKARHPEHLHGLDAKNWYAVLEFCGSRDAAWFAFGCEVRDYSFWGPSFSGPGKTILVCVDYEHSTLDGETLPGPESKGFARVNVVWALAGCRKTAWMEYATAREAFEAAKKLHAIHLICATAEEWNAALDRWYTAD